ncbi:MAG TPA: hypothetical protein PKD84_11200 [Propionicimonas sp.]|nr:hypothetical protein [Propionicimonas sp.]
MSEGSWYYCLKHHQVEPYEGCKAADRLGPYDTPGQASQALERVAVRNQEWDGEDEDEEAQEVADDDGWPQLPPQ